MILRILSMISLRLNNRAAIIKAGTHSAIITIITITITAIKFFKYLDEHYHVLIINPFIATWLLTQGKIARNSRKILLAMMSVFHILRRRAERRRKTKTRQQRKRRFWVREIFKNKTSSELNELLQELRMNNCEFHYRYFHRIGFF